MWDIVYSEINRFRDARKDKEEQSNIAKEIIKKALLKFYFDWNAYRNSGQSGVKWANPVLLEYSKLLVDVSVEVYEIVPEKLTNDVRSIATEIREAENELKYVTQDTTYDEAFKKSDDCSQEAFQVYNNFNKYFQGV